MSLFATYNKNDINESVRDVELRGILLIYNPLNGNRLNPVPTDCKHGFYVYSGWRRFFMFQSSAYRAGSGSLLALFIEETIAIASLLL